MYNGVPVLKILLISMFVFDSFAPIMGMVFLFHKDQSKTRG